MGFFLLDWNGEQHGGPGRKQHGEQNGARALGKGADAGQNAAGIAYGKAEQHQSGHHAVLPRRGNDDGQKHTVQGHAEGAHHPQRQKIARHNAQRRAHRPGGGGQQNGTVGVIGVQRARAGDRDAEQLVGDIIANEQPVEKRCAGGKALGQRTAHQQIARIGDERDNGHFGQRGPGGDQRKSRVFSGRCFLKNARILFLNIVLR